MKVSVIGAGAMGRWLVGFAKQNLGEVVVADANAAKAEQVANEFGTNSKSIPEAAAEAELVLVAVPISKTPEVIKSLAKQVQRGTLLVDVASVKSDVTEVMQTIEAEVELVSLHPLFGPGAIQCMTHFVLLTYLNALKSMKDLKRAEKLRTPMFTMLLDLAKTVLAGNPELYGELQVHNRYARVVRSSLLEACRSLDVAFSAGNAKSAKATFKEALAPWESAEVENAYKRMYELVEGDKT